MTLYAGVIISILISLALCVTKKSRDYLVKYYKESKKSMIWNGLIAYLDGFLISYCIQLTTAFKENNQEVNLKSSLNIILYTLIVFVTQIIIVLKLKSTSILELNSQSTKEKIGYLVRDYQLRDQLPYSKYFLSLSFALRTIVIFTVAFLPE